MLHVDCDAFFTSVEQALHPELKGKPVVTGKERGIVACASYEAKALGVRRPMRLFEAQKICRELICLPSDYEAYSLYSRRLFDILRRFTPDVEEFSVDEGFAELSGLRRIHRMGYADIARRIKQTVQAELGITVSVGLSASKTLAKIASKEKKPDGFMAVPAKELHRYLPRVALERVCGFGPNTVALLQKQGVNTVWDYVSRPELWAKRLLGKTGVELWHELRGEPVYPIVTKPKDDYLSISKTKTFTPPSSDRNFVQAQLLRNAESAFIKLRRYRLRARRVAVFLRDQEFRSQGMEGTLSGGTSEIQQAMPLLLQMFDKLYRPDLPYRATGIVLSKMDHDGVTQYSLFDDVPKIESLCAVARAVDEINGLYGKHTVHLGTGLWLGKHRRHLTARGDMPRRKTELLKGETFRRRLGVPLWQISV